MAKRTKTTAEALEWTGESRDAFHAKLAQGDVAGALVALESYPGVRRKDFAPQDKTALAGMNGALAGDAERQRALAMGLVSEHEGVRVGSEYLCTKLSAFDSENLVPAMETLFARLEKDNLARHRRVVAASKRESAELFAKDPDLLKKLEAAVSYAANRAERDTMLVFDELIAKFPPSSEAIRSFFMALAPGLVALYEHELVARGRAAESKEYWRQKRETFAEAAPAPELPATQEWSGDAARRCLELLREEGVGAVLAWSCRFKRVAQKDLPKIPAAVAASVSDALAANAVARAAFIDAMMGEHGVEALLARWIAASLPRFPVIEVIRRGYAEVEKHRPNFTAYPRVEDAFLALAHLLDRESVALLAECPAELRSSCGNARGATMRRHGSLLDWEEARSRALSYAEVLGEPDARDMLGAMIHGARREDPILFRLDSDLPFLRRMYTFDSRVDEQCSRMIDSHDGRSRKGMSVEQAQADWMALLRRSVVGKAPPSLHGAALSLAAVHHAGGRNALRNAVAALLDALRGAGLAEKLASCSTFGDLPEAALVACSFAEDGELLPILKRAERFWPFPSIVLHLADRHPQAVREFLAHCDTADFDRLRWRQSIEALLDRPGLALDVAVRLAACLQSESTDDHEWAFGIAYARPERLAPSGEDYLGLTARLIYAAKRRQDTWSAVDRVAFLGRSGRAPKDQVFAALEEAFHLDDPTAWRKAADAMREFRKELPHLALANADRVRELIARDPKKHGPIFKGLVE